MKTVAAILVELGKPLVIDELEIPLLKPGQALVEIMVTGVCHTQILEARGHRGADPYVPHCLGHEASGIVRDVATGVTRVKVGDPVVLSWIKGRGADVPGTTYAWKGKSVNAGGVTTFSRYSVVSENRLTKLDAAISFEQGALLGCAIPTGCGAVFNTAHARPGSSLAVIGCGGVGLNAISAARLAGCTPVIAIDTNPAKLGIAKKAGADFIIDASHFDVVSEIHRIVAGGVDTAIEASGNPRAMSLVLPIVRMQGGVGVVIGNAHHGQMLEIDPKQLNLGKRLCGSWGGDNEPERDFGRYQSLIMHGRLPMEHFQSPPYYLEEINQAIEDLEQGRTLRPLVRCVPV